MSKALDQLLSDGIIDAVISRLKTGKEAEIHLVEHKGEIVAAKIYKEQHARNFKHRAQYGEGRTVRNTRTQRAMDKGSRFGKAAEEEAWKSTESDALYKLHAAGMRVPQPVMFYEGILLMEVVIDAEGHPAPRLIDAQIPKERAAELYFDLRAQVIKMLCADLIHGDLSPYNVLMAWNGPTIIDFPQVVGAAHNRQAESFFERDLRALQKHFASIDPSLHGHADDARQIWKAYERRELTPDFVPVRNERPPQREFVPEPAQGRREFVPGAQGNGRREFVPGDQPRRGNGEQRGQNGHASGNGQPRHGGNPQERSQHNRRDHGAQPQGEQRNDRGPEHHNRGRSPQGEHRDARGPEHANHGGRSPQGEHRNGRGPEQANHGGRSPQREQRTDRGPEHHNRGHSPQGEHRNGRGPENQNHRGHAHGEHRNTRGPDRHKRGGNHEARDSQHANQSSGEHRNSEQNHRNGRNADQRQHAGGHPRNGQPQNGNGRHGGHPNQSGQRNEHSRHGGRPQRQSGPQVSYAPKPAAEQTGNESDGQRSASPNVTPPRTHE